MDANKHETICPTCGSHEVYYENARTGIGAYACHDCDWTGKEEDLSYSVPSKEYAENLAWRERAEQLLQKLEWGNDDGEHCPCCGKYKGNWHPNGQGHAVDCELKALIGEGKQ